MKIRRAKPSDVDDLVRLTLQLDEHVLRANPRLWKHRPIDDVRKMHSDHLTDPCFAVFLAEERKKLIGCMTGQVHSRPGAVPATVGMIDRAFVEKEWRSRSVGTALLDALLTFFESKGVEDVSLRYVLGDKEAESFWHRLGFQPIIQVANARPADLRRRLNELRNA